MDLLNLIENLLFNFIIDYLMYKINLIQTISYYLNQQCLIKLKIYIMVSFLNQFYQIF